MSTFGVGASYATAGDDDDGDEEFAGGVSAVDRITVDAVIIRDVAVGVFTAEVESTVMRASAVLRTCSTHRSAPT